MTKCSLIRKAIQRKKKIRFYYQQINEKGERYLLPNPSVCSPYQIFSYDGWLFLLVNKDGYSNLKVIKITYMVGIQILDSDRTPLDEVEDFKIRNFDMAAYLAQHSSPVTNQPEEIVFLLKNKVAFTPLYEEFGKNFTAVPIDQETYRVSLYGESEAFFHFALKYNNYIKVLSPASLVLRLYQYYKQAYEDYQDVPKNYSAVPNPKGALYHYFEKSFFKNEKDIQCTDDLREDFHRQYDLSFYTKNIYRYRTPKGDAVALDENTGKKYLIHMDFFNTDNPARINVETFGNIAHLEKLKPEYEQIYYACLFDISKIPFIRHFFSNPTPGMMFNEEGGFLPGNIDVNIRDEEGNIRTYRFEKGYAFTFHDIETTSLPYRYSVVKVK